MRVFLSISPYPSLTTTTIPPFRIKTRTFDRKQALSALFSFKAWMLTLAMFGVRPLHNLDLSLNSY